MFSFFQYKPGASLLNCEFVGFDNFMKLFGNPVMRDNLLRVLRNTLGIQALNYILMPIPMLFAIFLSEIRSKKFQKVVQTLTTLPHFISWVIMLTASPPKLLIIDVCSSDLAFMGMGVFIFSVQTRGIIV